jgi:hypothetical protein
VASWATPGEASWKNIRLALLLKCQLTVAAAGVIHSSSSSSMEGFGAVQIQLLHWLSGARTAAAAYAHHRRLSCGLLPQQRLLLHQQRHHCACDWAAVSKAYNSHERG